jgi:hypothetical protein
LGQLSKVTIIEYGGALMKASAQDEYGSPGIKHRRVIVSQHGGPDVLQVVKVVALAK